MNHTFRFSAPFDFSHTATYLGRFENDQAHAIGKDKFYQVLGDERGYFLVEVNCSNNKTVSASIVSDESDSRRQRQVKRFVERTFGPCETLQQFYDFAETHPQLKKWTRSFHGLRLVGIVNLWECLSWSIIGQQVSVQSAFSVRSRFSLFAGAVVEYNGKFFSGFPTPTAVLNMSERDLRNCGFSWQKADYVRGLAADVLNGELDEDFLLRLSPAEMRAKLISFRGIGPWSVEYAMMRIHGDSDACPVEDIGLRNAITRQYNLDHQATIQETRKITESWRPFRSYGTFYIWFTLLTN